MTRYRLQVHRRTSAVGQGGGIVLLMVLMILVLISGIALWAAKSSISGEQLATNLRVRANVDALAELALRYCEDGLLKNSTALIRLPSPLNGIAGELPSAWQILSNWKPASNQINVVPFARLQDALGRVPVASPVCMIEEIRLAPLDTQRLQAFLITARGFSPDYAEAGNGSITRGTDAWVQSMLRF